MNISRAKVGAGYRVTLPPDVRCALSLAAGDQISFEIDGESVRLVRPVQFTLEEAHGSVAPLNDEPQDFDAMIDLAKEEYFAEKWARERSEGVLP